MQTKKCISCGRNLPITEYHNSRVSKKGKQYKSSYCKSCNLLRGNDWRNSNIANFLNSSFLKLRGHAKEKDTVFTITLNEVINQYIIQNGKCFYTDTDMSWGSELNPKTSISYDKIIPELGYVTNNVVLCCKRINTIKNDLTLEELKQYIPSWYERIERKLYGQ